MATNPKPPAPKEPGFLDALKDAAEFISDLATGDIFNGEAKPDPKPEVPAGSADSAGSGAPVRVTVNTFAPKRGKRTGAAAGTEKAGKAAGSGEAADGGSGEA